MAIHIPPSPSRWSAKHWILVTLIGTLVAIAIVAVISISLSPARIHFSILSATFEHPRLNDRYYNFTLVANNTSRRTAVRYVALSAEIWYSPTRWVPAEVYTIALPSKWQPGRNATNIPFSGDYWQFDFDVPNATSNTMVSDSDWPNTTVVVIAKVWFKFVLAQTRPYNVRVSCKPVDFFNHSNRIFPVNCTDG